MAYQAANKERLLLQKRKYYEENKDDWKERSLKNEDHIKEYRRKYRLENHERLSQLSKAWKKANPEKVLQSISEYKIRNPGFVAAGSRRRRAKIAGAAGSHTTADIDSIFEMQNGKCANCTKKLFKSGKKKYHVDHIMPLAKGGTNGKENLQCLCPDCNLRKSAKHPLDWAKENGKLL